MGVEVIEHTADTGIRVWAPDLSMLFAEAARGMFSRITDLEQITPLHARKISFDGIDETDLLINTLRELLYLFIAESLLIKSFSVESMRNGTATGEIQYEKYDPEKHDIHKEIKAVTYAGKDIEKTPGGYEATIIFDV